MPIVADNQCSIAVNHRSSIGEARRISLVMAERVKFKEDARGRVALITTELATNILLHAQNGEILFRILPVEWGPGLEIVALDHGPGISDLKRCMSDGYSTRGTRGCGLGAVYSDYPAISTSIRASPTVQWSYLVSAPNRNRPRT